jgi:hypothetical protein
VLDFSVQENLIVETYYRAPVAKRGFLQGKTVAKLRAT